MYRTVINDKLVDSSPKKRDIKINFGKVYIFLLVFSFALIYFYSVMQGNYLSIMIPYRIIWPISIIFIGISIFRVKNTAAFSVGFFITTLSVGLTITSIFVYSSNIVGDSYTNILPVSDTNLISSDFHLVNTNAKIKSDSINLFKSDFNSNYDNIVYSNYKDENKVDNIKIEQVKLQPGIGAYIKNSDIVLPNNISNAFKLKTSVSKINFDMSNMKLESSSIASELSSFEINIDSVRLEEDTMLDIESNLSIFNIIISTDIPVIIANSSSLSQTEFIGLSQSTNSPNIYQTSVQTDSSEESKSSEIPSEENKKLIINLNSTLSQIKITQR